ncbi:hypothetical protein L7F22_031120 [Adiantum nelumboides]|nr:hypothetical protein [Adiantum nelumboides]
MLYGVQVWGPSVDQDSWRAMERPLISMISRMIRAKASVPHAIIRAKVAAPPIEMEALTKSVSFIHGIWNTDRCRYTRSALESSRQIALKGDTSCWYAKTNLWFQRHGFSMDRLPPFQYSLEAPSLPITKAERNRIISLPITKAERNRIIRQDLIQLDTKRTWVESIQELGTKMAFYRGNFLQVSEDGFVTRPSYMDTHLSHGLRCAIGQIRTSSHQLEIEFGRFQGIPPEDRLFEDLDARNSSMRDHINKMQELQQEILHMGKLISSENMAIQLLAQLPSRYSNFYSSLITSRRLNTISWDEIVPMVLDQGERFNAGKKPGSEALAGSFNNNNKKQKGKKKCNNNPKKSDAQKDALKADRIVEKRAIVGGSVQSELATIRHLRQRQFSHQPLFIWR